MTTPEHVPVLLRETLDFLKPRAGGVYVDGTLGLGGHTEAILDASSPDGRVLGIDQDPDALAFAQQRLERFGERVAYARANYSTLAAVLDEHAIDGVDGVLIDAGMSSYQLDDSGRGFSFLRDEPLDMRMNPETPFTASDVVNEWREEYIESTFRVYGEERFSKRIARAIVERRRNEPFRTTTDLAALIERVVPGGRKQRIHPATRVFQALRIVVNEELDHLNEGLTAALSRLNPGGVLVVIAFHSLEDRIVKHRFRSAVRPPGTSDDATPDVIKRLDFELLTKKPVTATEQETRDNPRSRSAKLRAIRRVLSAG